MKSYPSVFSVLFLMTMGCNGPSIDYAAIEMNDSIEPDSVMDEQITPYRDSLVGSMETVIVHNEIPLKRGRPESTLGNLIADLLLERAMLETPDSIIPDMCLVNIGGLRVDLPDGPITVGKVFELMPFENELEIVRLSLEETDRMFQYIKDVNGQPFSGMTMLVNGEDIAVTLDNGNDPHEGMVVATSDYLADGGDHMEFFVNPVSRVSTGVKIRDAILDHFRVVGLQDRKLESSLDGRMKVNE